MGSSSSSLNLPRKLGRSPRLSRSSSQPSSSTCKLVGDELVAEAMALKNQGNELFRSGDFKEAEQIYTLAYEPVPSPPGKCNYLMFLSSDAFYHSIQKNPSEPKLFSNRALARVKLQDWSGAETDARKSIELYGPKNSQAMKAYYTLSEALLGLNHPREALETAKYAYQICLEIRDSSSEVISRFILRTKQAQWQNRETARLGELNATLGNVETLLQQQLNKALQDLDARYESGEISDVGRSEDRVAIQKESEEQRDMVRQAFSANVQAEELAERVDVLGFLLLQSPWQSTDVFNQIVPDYLIDGITFEIMHDPVITPSGVSYERISIMKHLKQSAFDPLTRAPLREQQLIPNVALRNASSEFLEKNGWAIDY